MKKKQGKFNRLRRLTASFIDWTISLFICRTIAEVSLLVKDIDLLVLIIFLIILFIQVFLLRKKDTYFSKQYRSLGKKMMGLYIVDAEGKLLKDKELIEQKNKITLTLEGWMFYIYRVLIFNESEAEDKLKIYVVTKRDVKVS